MLTRLHVGRQAAEAWRELADAFTKLSKFEDAAKAYQQSLAEVGVAAAPDIIGWEAGTRWHSSAAENQSEQMTPQPSPAG